MANPKRGQANITLSDGKTYLLVFDFNAMAELERRMGASIPDIFDFDEETGQARKTPGFNFIVQAITSGLKRRYPKMHAAKVGELLDPDHFGDYSEAVGEAINGFFGGDKLAKEGAAEPENEGVSPGEAPAAPSAPHGSGSGSSGTQPPQG